MRDNGIRRAAVFTTSAWGGYSSCTQYVEDIARGPRGRRRGRAGAGQAAPVLRPPAVRRDVRRSDRRGRADSARLTPGWCSPRIPFPTAARSRCGPDLYSRQVAYASRLVAAAAGYDDYDQVWQSRSGPPQVPWLEPDVVDHLTSLAEAGTKAVIVCPIGFVADHIEVVWDLDHELWQQAQDLGIAFARAATPNADPRFARLAARPDRRAAHRPLTRSVAGSGRPTAAGLFGRRRGVHAELWLVPGRVQDRADGGHPRRTHHPGQRTQCVAGDLHLR